MLPVGLLILAPDLSFKLKRFKVLEDAAACFRYGEFYMDMCIMVEADKEK